MKDNTVCSPRCLSKLSFAGRVDRCMNQRGHIGWHRWWSVDARVQVQWAQGAGGLRWRYPVK